jgi:hypothetical protein
LAWTRPTFGETAPSFLLQGFTAAILVLTANTAFNGLPALATLAIAGMHI